MTLSAGMSLELALLGTPVVVAAQDDPLANPSSRRLLAGSFPRAIPAVDAAIDFPLAGPDGSVHPRAPPLATIVTVGPFCGGDGPGIGHRVVTRTAALSEGRASLRAGRG